MSPGLRPVLGEPDAWRQLPSLLDLPPRATEPLQSDPFRIAHFVCGVALPAGVRKAGRDLLSNIRKIVEPDERDPVKVDACLKSPFSVTGSEALYTELKKLVTPLKLTGFQLFSTCVSVLHEISGRSLLDLDLVKLGSAEHKRTVEDMLKLTQGSVHRTLTNAKLHRLSRHAKTIYQALLHVQGEKKNAPKVLAILGKCGRENAAQRKVDKLKRAASRVSDFIERWQVSFGDAEGERGLTAKTAFISSCQILILKQEESHCSKGLDSLCRCMERVSQGQDVGTTMAFKLAGAVIRITQPEALPMIEDVKSLVNLSQSPNVSDVSQSVVRLLRLTCKDRPEPIDALEKLAEAVQCHDPRVPPWQALADEGHPFQCLRRFLKPDQQSGVRFLQEIWQARDTTGPSAGGVEAGLTATLGLCKLFVTGGASNRLCEGLTLVKDCAVAIRHIEENRLVWSATVAAFACILKGVQYGRQEFVICGPDAADATGQQSSGSPSSSSDPENTGAPNPPGLARNAGAVEKPDPMSDGQEAGDHGWYRIGSAQAGPPAASEPLATPDASWAQSEESLSLQKEFDTDLHACHEMLEKHKDFYGELCTASLNAPSAVMDGVVPQLQSLQKASKIWQWLFLSANHLARQGVQLEYGQCTPTVHLGIKIVLRLQIIDSLLKRVSASGIGVYRCAHALVPAGHSFSWRPFIGR